ncbi:phosphate ABC transporter permease subunit PstC [Leptolyngbya sp. FACHB-261]|uniref:phosphate ABC transporter permease subunit PstC n=1 Tax=Leptolyngbya sp. FACHB-261 TaxID=2692806 RepID=UPI001F558E0E|nr:phosphate ABC transporter permease subunit PstC [Leptolyngbya sp. FACHB-261]
MSAPVQFGTSGSLRRILDRLFVSLTALFALLVVGVLLVTAGVIGSRAMPAIQAFGLGFLTSADWDVLDLKFGVLPLAYGTLVSSLIALVLAVPVSIGVAIVLTEDFLPRAVRTPLSFMVELLAAVPSVIYGLWGVNVLIPLLLPFQTWLNEKLGWFPLFSTPASGFGLMTAGIVLAIMILPTIAAISRDVLLVLPSEFRSASMALGATRWETIFRVLLPSGASGILGATMLGLGRALGETMAVTMVIGNNPVISPSILDLSQTIASLLATQFGEAVEPLHIGALMYAALVLFGLTLLVNIIAELLVRTIQLERT